MNIHTDISNGADFFDSRDIITRIEELESEDYSDLDDDEREELQVLTELATEGKGCPDWPYGTTLIRESYFEDYARDLAEDIGAVPTDGSWPTSYIDWERAADALLMDYTALDYDGVTYYARA